MLRITSRVDFISFKCFGSFQFKPWRNPLSPDTNNHEALVYEYEASLKGIYATQKAKPVKTPVRETSENSLSLSNTTARSWSPSAVHLARSSPTMYRNLSRFLFHFYRNSIGPRVLHLQLKKLLLLE